MEFTAQGISVTDERQAGKYTGAGQGAPSHGSEVPWHEHTEAFGEQKTRERSWTPETTLKASRRGNFYLEQQHLTSSTHGADTCLWPKACIQVPPFAKP